MQLSTNFKLQEFVPKEFYDKYGEKALWFIDERLPVMAQTVRDELTKHYGQPVIVKINTWSSDGARNYSGRRPYNVDKQIKGATESQHKMGRAIDMQCFINGVQIPAKEVGAYILANQAVFMQAGITTIENPDATPTWTHIDCRWTQLPNILTVNP